MIDANEILLASYWEHVKAEKDLARILHPNHKKRVELNKAANEILEQIHNNQNIINND